MRSRNGSLKAKPLDIKADWLFDEVGEQKHYTIQAWQDGRIIGRAHGWFEPRSEFVIEKIEIGHRYRSKGYGSVLIRALRQKARSLHCKDFVFRSVRANNHRAIVLYESMGAAAQEESHGPVDFVIAPP